MTHARAALTKRIGGQKMVKHALRWRRAASPSRFGAARSLKALLTDLHPLVGLRKRRKDSR